MNKSNRLFLLFALSAAITIMAVLFFNIAHLKNELTGLQDQLSESRQTWERIADEKVQLQAELKTKKEELKDAELSLSEANERAATLKGDIEILKHEIEALQMSLQSSD